MKCYYYCKLFFVLIFVLCFANFLAAQEVLTDLPNNIQLLKESKNVHIKSSITNAEPVKLPFVDDFSDYNLYPNPLLWEDKQGFVNSTFPINPPSIGVVTLDALDEFGKIYSHASESPFAADTLTSHTIRLDSVFNPNRPVGIQDSVYFSFYYQPGGGTFSHPYLEWERIGNRPDNEDKLILEFGYATGDTIFTGYSYAEYILGEGESYVIGDSLENPYIPGTYYVFESNAFPGQTILLPFDSLFGPEKIWSEVWSSNGCKLDDWLDADSLRLTYFKQVLIPITDPIYFRNNFQFRFRNYASLEPNGVAGWASNVDQWHIDYIILNINRTKDDIYPNDIAFALPTTTFLNKYYSMPWNQFQVSDMKSAFNNQLANISNTTKNTSYSYHVVKNGSQIVGNYVSNNENAYSYYPNGFHTYPMHANPSINFAISYDNQDSATFLVTHIFQVVGGTGDARHQNDTSFFEQKFYNYYAYDDGTAEAGYSLLSTMASPEASFAVKFTLAYPDTLRCVRMWFNNVLENANFDYFTLKVWDDDNGFPGNELYSSESLLPSQSSDFLDFVSYFLEEPLFVSGTFYVGFYQNHDTQLNLGFDQNSDARGNFFYKTADEWVESFFKGAPMVRPVLGKYFSPVSVPNNSPVTFSVFPNPTSQYVTIKLNDDSYNFDKVMIYDMYGKLLKIYTSGQNSNVIDLSSFAPGVYVLHLVSGSKILGISKIVKL